MKVLPTVREFFLLLFVATYLLPLQPGRTGLVPMYTGTTTTNKEAKNNIFLPIHIVLFYLFLCVSFSHYTILRLRTQDPKQSETLFPQLLSCSWLHGFSCKQNLLTWGSQFCKSTFYLSSASCFPDNSTATVGSNLQKFQVVNGVNNYFL